MGCLSVNVWRWWWFLFAQRCCGPSEAQSWNHWPLAVACRQSCQCKWKSMLWTGNESDCVSSEQVLSPGEPLSSSHLSQCYALESKMEKVRAELEKLPWSDLPPPQFEKRKDKVRYIELVPRNWYRSSFASNLPRSAKATKPTNLNLWLLGFLTSMDACTNFPPRLLEMAFC